MDGIAVASTVLAMQALRRAVKIRLWFRVTVLITLLMPIVKTESLLLQRSAMHKRCTSYSSSVRLSVRQKTYIIHGRWRISRKCHSREIVN